MRENHAIVHHPVCCLDPVKNRVLRLPLKLHTVQCICDRKLTFYHELLAAKEYFAIH